MSAFVELLERIVFACDAVIPKGATTFVLLRAPRAAMLNTVIYSGAQYLEKGYHRLALSPSHAFAKLLREPQIMDLPLTKELMPLPASAINPPAERILVVPVLTREREVLGMLCVTLPNLTGTTVTDVLNKVAPLASLIDTALQVQRQPLDDSADRFRRLHEKSVDPVAIISRELSIVEGNTAMARLLNTDADALPGLALANYVTEKSVAGRISAKFRLVEQSGVVFFETQIKRQGGGVIDVVVHASAVNINNQTMFKAFFHDVTAKNRSVEEIKKVIRQVTLILESTTDAYISVDAQWRIAYFNARAEELFKQARQTVLKRDLWEVLPGLSDNFHFAITSAQQSQKMTVVEGYYPDQNKWFEAHVYPHADGASVYLRDITEATTAEQTLRENDIYLRTVLSNVVDAIITLDDNGLVDTANPAAERTLRCSRNFMIGKPFTEWLAPPLQYDWPELLVTLRDNEHQKKASHRCEVIALRNDNERFEADIAVNLVALANRRMYVITLRDISEMKTAERKIAGLAKFPDQNPSPVMRVGRDGKLEYANDATQPLLAAWGIRVGDELPLDLRRTFRRALDNGVNCDVEESAGNRIYSLIFAPVPDQHYVNIYGRDISERVFAETELRNHRDHLEDLVKDRTVDLAIARDQAQQASRTKSSFLANMSHELRTPLNAIIGYTELLKEDAEDSGDNALLVDLDKIRRSATHLLELINDILDLSKIEAGKVGLHIDFFNVKALLSAVSETVMPAILKNENELIVNVDDDKIELESDETRVRQCLLNLLSNAAKFTERGQIRITAGKVSKADEAWVTFVVEDNGIGMTDSQLKRLFQTFTQTETKNAAKYGGTGLGLAISRRLCRMLGGDITVTSVRGGGSRFEMQLPINLTPLQRKKLAALESELEE